MSASKLSRYELIAVVAQGQLGPIWDGYDPDIRRKVTVKVAPVEHLSAEAAEALALRFRTEARVAGKLLHPNIVGVYDAGVESGLAYIVTETVTGASLDAMLRQPGGVPQEMVGRIALQMLAALDYAHSKDVAHLGLQPSQVMVTPGGAVKVSDFGAVAAAEPDDSTRSQGSLSETIRCLAPEQVLGLQADARADLWSVGVMLYRMWTGQWPFNAESDFGLIQKIIKQAVPPPSGVATQRVPPLGDEHDQLLARALAKSAAERYPGAREFAAELSRLVAREAAVATVGGSAANRAAVAGAVAAAATSAAPPVPAAARPPVPEVIVPLPPPATSPASIPVAEADDEATRVIRLPVAAPAHATTALVPAFAPEPVVANTPMATPAASAKPEPRPVPPPARPSYPARSRGWLLALAGLLVVGAGAALVLKRGPAPEAAAPAQAASAAASAQVIAAPAAPSTPATSSVVAEAAPALPASTASAAPPVPVSANAKPPTARDQAARKVAEAARAKAASAPVPARPAAPPVAEEPQRATVVVEAPKAVEAPASVAPAVPAEPCGKRVMLARLACMKEACAKSEWVRHPQCVEWRRMEERRNSTSEQQN